MGLFDFIKSILGKDESTRERVDGTNVSVEREPDSEGVSEAEGEEEIGEAEREEEIGEAEREEEIGEAEGDDEPIAEPTDATGSTESILDDDAASEPATAFEPSEATGPEPEDMSTDVEGTGPEPGSEGIDETETGEEIDEAERGEEIDEAEGDDEPIAEPTDATGSTASILDDDAASEPETAFEPSDAVGPESEDMTTDVEEMGPESESAAPADGEPSVQEIKGIGPAYSERLSEAGVVTVADLADADAADLAERTAVSESRVQEWIDRARDFEE